MKELVKKATIPTRVFGYLSYTEYMRDSLSFLIERQARFSLRKWAKELAMTPAYLSMILNKKRPLTLKKAKAISDHFQHNQQERDYFKALVQFQNEGVPSIREEYFKVLSSYRSFQAFRPRDLVLSKYLSSPAHVIIRESIELADFELNPEWFKDRFWIPITKSEVLKSVSFLKENEFISADENQKIKQMDFQINCSAEALRSSMGRFHREMFKYTADSIQKVPRENRNIQSHVACLSENQFLQVKKVIDEALVQIEKITSREEQKTNMYYIGMQLVPLSNQRNLK